LANTGSRTLAIGGSALLFGLFHLNPYHVVIATALGLVLGFCTLESGSIFISMLIHFVNNGIRVLGVRVPAVEKFTADPRVMVAACVVTVIGMVILRNRGQT